MIGTNNNIAEQLEHHWALDRQAAETLEERVVIKQAFRIEELVGQLDEKTVRKRDANRELLAKIFTRQVDKSLVVIGPCSLDEQTDYLPLFDFIEELQGTHTNTLIALRANGAKPRTATGWTGLWYSVEEEKRKRLLEIYSAAASRGIPILAEITEPAQLGALAPWMSGIWLGARDISSTTLRRASSAYHLPVGVKNGIDGCPQVLKDTILAIESNTEQNDGSGVDLGTVASSHNFVGIPTGILPVGEGNKQIAIFARGYELSEGMNSEERRDMAIKHLSQMCILGAELGCGVVIDGSHGVPPMFAVSRRDPDRIVPVLEEINRAIERGEIDKAQQFIGVMAEVGPSIGKTDPNYLLDSARRVTLNRLLGTTIDLIASAHPIDLT